MRADGPRKWSCVDSKVQRVLRIFSAIVWPMGMAEVAACEGALQNRAAGPRLPGTRSTCGIVPGNRVRTAHSSARGYLNRGCSRSLARNWGGARTSAWCSPTIEAGPARPQSSLTKVPVPSRILRNVSATSSRSVPCDVNTISSDSSPFSASRSPAATSINRR